MLGSIEEAVAAFNGWFWSPGAMLGLLSLAIGSSRWGEQPGRTIHGWRALYSRRIFQCNFVHRFIEIAIAKLFQWHLAFFTKMYLDVWTSEQN